MEIFKKEDFNWRGKNFLNIVFKFKKKTKKALSSTPNAINHLNEWRVKVDSGELCRPSLMEWILKPPKWGQFIPFLNPLFSWLNAISLKPGVNQSVCPRLKGCMFWSWAVFISEWINEKKSLDCFHHPVTMPLSALVCRCLYVKRV